MGQHASGGAPHHDAVFVAREEKKSVGRYDSLSFSTQENRKLNSNILKHLIESSEMVKYFHTLMVTFVISSPAELIQGRASHRTVGQH